MESICAWCHTVLPATDCQCEGLITHGMCQECADYFRAVLDHPSLQEFLDRLGVPVLLVDDDVRILLASEMARKLLGKVKGAFEGHHGGDVIECANARLPGGCGKTLHCKGCAIRNSVQETYATGESHEKVLAHANVVGTDGPIRTRFLISTEKVGQFVLLRIDEVST